MNASNEIIVTPMQYIDLARLWKSRLHPPGQKSAERVSDAPHCTAEQSRPGADWFIDYQTTTWPELQAAHCCNPSQRVDCKSFNASCCSVMRVGSKGVLLWFPRPNKVLNCNGLIATWLLRFCGAAFYCILLYC